MMEVQVVSQGEIQAVSPTELNGIEGGLNPQPLPPHEGGPDLSMLVNPPMQF
jgi:hypothetical protein